MGHCCRLFQCVLAARSQQGTQRFPASFRFGRASFFDRQSTGIASTGILARSTAFGGDYFMRPTFPALLRTSAFTLIGGAAAFATLTYAAVTPNDATDQAAASPTAYVYMNESNSTGTVTQTEGFAVAANGALSSLPGSPYSAVTEGSMGV